jgi:hypothetical protein
MSNAAYTRTVAYGPGVLQRAFDACMELLAAEAEQRI